MEKFYVTFMLVVLTLTTTTNLFSQRSCHTMEYLQYMQEKDPNVRKQMLRIENHTHSFEQSPHLRSDNTIVIPVVFHVLFNTTSEKISEEVLLSQIDVLNEDFQRLNADQTNFWSQAANVNIEFRLAKIAPDKSATNGMVHKFTNKAFFQANDDMMFDNRGGSNAWPTDQYLNIWVCDLFGNKIGYAQLPGGGDYATDGVVVDYQAVGRTNNSSKFALGRTATHEVGHWLNLRHIWGDGDCNRDDYVADTPASSYPTFGCQPNKTTCGSLDMTANFLDYSNDECMNLFTEGQKTRMRALFSRGGFRESILSSPAFGGVYEEPEDAPVEGEECPNGPNCPEEPPVQGQTCASPTQLKLSFGERQLDLSWQGSAIAYTFELKLPNATRWYTFSTQRNQLSISGVTSVMVGEARLRAECGDGETSAYAYFEVGNSRVAGESTSSNLLVYPNPVRKELFLEWDKLSDFHFNGAQFQRSQRTPGTFIELYDRTGRLVIRQAADSDQFKAVLQVSNLQGGLYFLIQRSQNGVVLAQKKIQVL